MVVVVVKRRRREHRSARHDDDDAVTTFFFVGKEKGDCLALLQCSQFSIFNACRRKSVTDSSLFVHDNSNDSVNSDMIFVYLGCICHLMCVSIYLNFFQG